MTIRKYLSTFHRAKITTRPSTLLRRPTAFSASRFTQVLGLFLSDIHGKPGGNRNYGYEIQRENPIDALLALTLPGHDIINMMVQFLGFGEKRLARTAKTAILATIGSKVISPAFRTPGHIVYRFGPKLPCRFNRHRARWSTRWEAISER